MAEDERRCVFCAVSYCAKNLSVADELYQVTIMHPTMKPVLAYAAPDLHVGMRLLGQHPRRSPGMLTYFALLSLVPIGDCPLMAMRIAYICTWTPKDKKLTSINACQGGHACRQIKRDVDINAALVSHTVVAGIEEFYCGPDMGKVSQKQEATFADARKAVDTICKEVAGS